MIDEFKNKIIDLLQNKGLYSSYDNVAPMIYRENLLRNSINNLSLDLFCPTCKKEKTFIEDYYDYSHYNYLKFDNQETAISTVLCLNFYCPTCKQKLNIFTKYENNKIIKVGQYPSLMDMDRNEINKYKKLNLIDSNYFDELKKAEICAGESYYVAAFLYLRRVFENLVKNIFNQNIEEIGITQDDFSKKRSNEKLDLLKPYLAVDDSIYAPLYKLLSEGIHALSENECGENYDLLKYILLDILEEQESQKRKKESRKKMLEIVAQKKGGANEV